MSIEDKIEQPNLENPPSPQEEAVRPDLRSSLERLKGLMRTSSRAEEGQVEEIDLSFQKSIEYLDGLIDKAKQGVFTSRSTPHANDPSINVLTKREREILKLIANGSANKNIASNLSISIRTVEVHRSNLTHKLGIKSTAGLVKYAISQGLV